MKQLIITSIIVFFAGSLAAAILIYTTPLRYTDHIEPTIYDMQSTEFYDEYHGHADGYLFIDVRGPSAYNEKHAEGSINIPLHQLYNQREFLPKDGKEIVLICSGGVASGVGYSYLEHYGFTNIRRIGDGIEGWEAEGLPLGDPDIRHDHSSH